VEIGRGEEIGDVSVEWIPRIGFPVLGTFVKAEGGRRKWGR